ncbi:DUF1192 family protein [Xanthobacter sp. TB0136]|uniref:DUF1192 family protein n=1 Tax=Xanthobacter sp. TB0136 TaxID=3459177 RepID=UPI0040398D4A
MNEEPRANQADGIRVGADLSALSEAEILERIAALKVEITRLEQTLASKQASRAAADAAFRF